MRTACRASLVEKVADLVRFNHDPVAIAEEAIDIIRAETLKEAAMVADEHEDDMGHGKGAKIAAAIRALKEKA